ncbi:MAG TPA: type I-U CRISPR-associated protein Csb2 [Dermatophilaceae bacterium]|jgi:CRISPR-associated protein Csb2|nr:type I-U CRISPR-associated protein Csb2 [Dermatophilaceae bacterium]HMT89486.1 type I-U CRISPR-associated protein Csb2 [Dermatophilaceae bacterium]
MALALAFRFPLGEYHATPWDRAANSGDSEWPPSSWRILRALLSAWHTRCPEVASDDVERIINLLATEPPSYLLPAVGRSHTRHYLPGVSYTEVVRDTSMTLAPRLHVPADERVVVLWPSLDLHPDDRQVLGRLAAALGYLGRADSVCDARLLEADELAELGELDLRWTRPTESADDLRVLVAAPDVTRSQLEVSPDRMREARRLIPVGARWQAYRRGQEASRGPRSPRRLGTRRPTAMRWALGGPVGTRVIDGVLATSGLRKSALWMLNRAGLDTSSEAWLLAGPHDAPGASEWHRHAHWLWLGEPTAAGKVTDVVLWVPDGIPEDMLGALVGVRSLAKIQEPPRGYVPAPVHLQALGTLKDVAPELTGASVRWTTVTPMLAGRHPKKHRDPARFIEHEVARELSFRDWGEGVSPRVRSVEVSEHWATPRVPRTSAAEAKRIAPVARYRRYRLGESMAQRRPGFRVTIELDRPIEGPVSLGALNHFGFGLFRAG